MNKTLLASVLAGVAALTAAVPASATVILCAGSGQQCAPQTDDNVLITAATNVDHVLASFNSGGTSAVGFFDSSENLSGDANGQAVVSAANGSVLNDLTFTLTGGSTFGVATFNLSGAGQVTGTETTSVFVTSIGLGGVLTTQQFTINTNGSNFLGFYGTAGERFTGLSFVSDPVTSGIADFRQLRLGDVRGPVPSVPEPSTWAMLLLGFGTMGVSLRRRRRASGAQLAQVA